ncbi:MAG: PLP-dependent aspartate aminotransferase family protein [Desulfovibrio sp.]|jgi:cystathionine beta-lyase/cystathionine gamma-synthase|nr:PLP-dependent aspartate aminotransferase family protein [Desulfovibrio sp.]
MKTDSMLAQAGSRQDPRTGAIAMPIHPSAAFQHPALGQSTGFDYSRTSNPTRLVLERTIAALDGGSRGLAFASGLAAVDAALRLFSPGDALLITEDLYGGTFRLCENFGRSRGLDFHYVDTADLKAVSAALDRPGIKGLFVEMPTNPLLKVADLAALASLARKRRILYLVDNTFLTPALCRPLEFGADVTVYSATKYLGGHNDLIAGLLVAKNPELGERLAFIQNAAGAILGPFESWLLLRSLKTLHLRLKRHEENARAIAAFLAGHPKISRLHYPGLPSDPGHATLGKQARGYGGMLSFEVASRAVVEHILASVRVFLFAESLGATESLVTFPLVQTHADMPADVQQRIGLTERLVRLSVGLEDPEDLIGDLAGVLD